MTDFYSQLEDQLLAAGRRRQAQGRVARAVAGRGRVLAVATAAVAVLVVALAFALPGAVTSVFDSGPTPPAAPPPAPAPLPGPAVSLAGIRLAVFNATTRPGAGRGVADELEARGADVATLGALPAQPDAVSTVRYRAGAEGKARRVAAVLGVPRVERYDPATVATENPPVSVRIPVIVLVGYDREAAPSPRAAGYPNSIAVLGDAGGSENSWATGANPAVNSVYRRILARNPLIGGHNLDLTRQDANADALAGQAKRALAINPNPELFVIQIMDNDIACPLSPVRASAFASGLGTALDILAVGAPQAKVFVVSRFGRPAGYAHSLTAGERRSIGATSVCGFIDPRGRVVPDKLAALERVIARYEFHLERQCQRFAVCRYDRGAFGRIVDRRVYLAASLRGLSVEGNARAAAVAWAALQRAGVIPN